MKKTLLLLLIVFISTSCGEKDITKQETTKLPKQVLEVQKIKGDLDNSVAEISFEGTGITDLVSNITLP